VLRTATRLLLAHELEIRGRLHADLMRREPSYAALDEVHTLDSVCNQQDLFDTAYPWFETVWYRWLRFQLERADRRIDAVERHVRRHWLGQRSVSAIWHVMHTSTDVELHWQCPDCTQDGRCSDPDPAHLCVAQIVLDVTSVTLDDRPDGNRPLCHFCGQAASPATRRS
jgi:hypothetical protein